MEDEEGETVRNYGTLAFKNVVHGTLIMNPPNSPSAEKEKNVRRKLKITLSYVCLV